MIRWLLAAIGVAIVIFAAWLQNQPFCAPIGPTPELLGLDLPKAMVPVSYLAGYAITAVAAVMIFLRGARAWAVALVLLVLTIGYLGVLQTTNTGPGCTIYLRPSTSPR
jgi:hypothetical protein